MLNHILVQFEGRLQILGSESGLIEFNETPYKKGIIIKMCLNLGLSITVTVK